MAIDPELLLHPSDKAALQALKSIPGFDQLVKAYMSILNERQLRIINMSTNLRLGEEQMPEYFHMLPPICEKLGIPVPELYIELNVVPNAYTYGDTNPFIVLTSGLLETIPNDLIPTVLAHECGHIACRHTLYRTMGSFILNGIDQFVTGLASLLTSSIKVAFAYWMRCSEFSADRAAVLCDGSYEKMAEVCFRLAGNDKDIHATASIDAFMKQAEDYRAMTADSKWNKTLEFLLLSSRDHPLTAVRALESREWAASGQFRKVCSLLAYHHSSECGALKCDIPSPESSKGCIRKNEDELSALFRAAGFDNLQFIRTIEKGIAAQDGQVVSAAIEGVRPFEKGEWIPSDTRIVFIYYETPSAEEIAAAHPGQVQLPKNASQYIGRNHQEVYNDLFVLGFNNIQEHVQFVKRSWILREGNVVKVTIGSDQSPRQEQWYPAEVPVVVEYILFEADSHSNIAEDTMNAAGNMMENLFRSGKKY